ncbi:MAG: hypothetical protein JRC68_08110 [Deltaproteobacteria bacterium]|nr:hypothetical protein [Deltaproteobacteria bacterium]
MVLYNRNIMIMIALSFVVLLGTVSVFAQPLGILGSQVQKQTQHKVLSSENGRFIFGQISDSGKDQFMLDTVSGRLWRIAESGTVGIFLKPVKYRTGEKQYSDLPGRISDMKPKRPKK